MPDTPLVGLPYPVPTDPADVPADLEALAMALDEILGAPAPTTSELTYGENATPPVVTNVRQNMVIAPPFTLAERTAVVAAFSLQQLLIPVGIQAMFWLLGETIPNDTVQMTTVQASYAATPNNVWRVDGWRRIELNAGTHNLRVEAYLSAAGSCAAWGPAALHVSYAGPPTMAGRPADYPPDYYLHEPTGAKQRKR